MPKELSLEKVEISPQEIQAGVEEITLEAYQGLANEKGPIVVMGIMTGAMFRWPEVCLELRRINRAGLHFIPDALFSSTRANDGSILPSQDIRLSGKFSLKGTTVLLVDGLVDSQTTLRYLV